MKKFYDVLGLNIDATQKEIDEAYIKLSVDSNLKANNNEEFLKIEHLKILEAYKAVSNKSNLGDENTTLQENTSDLSNRKTSPQHHEYPDGLKVLSILSMIGSGLMGLLFILIFSFAGSFFGGYYSPGGTFVILMGLLFVSIFTVKFIGALKMYNLKKSGFLMYSIANIIWIVIVGMSLANQEQTGWSLFTLLSSIVFLIIFYSYKKHYYR